MVPSFLSFPLEPILLVPLPFSTMSVITHAVASQLTLTALNLSKSAYVCITFASNRFFSRYSFEGNAQYRDRFFCQLYIRVIFTGLGLGLRDLVKA